MQTSMTSDLDEDIEPRTDLDSHANMPVVGRNAYVLSNTGKMVDVSPFTPDYKPMRVPIVDSAVKYACPFSGKEYILVIRNALHVPTMENNLIPPFMMREAGIQVTEIPKIQIEDPTEKDHAIIFPETNFCIPLSLWGIFSYFPTKKPTHDELVDPSEVYMLTPSVWNPHSSHYAHNEENMLDWEGNMREKRDRTEMKIVLDEIDDDPEMVASLWIGEAEDRSIYATFMSSEETLKTSGPYADDVIAAMTANISTTLHDETMYNLMKERAETGIFMSNIG